MRWALVAVLCISGCRQAAEFDPESSRLAYGSEAVAFSRDLDIAGIEAAPGSPGTTPEGKGTMQVGRKVRVVADESAIEKDQDRKIRVLVLEGEYKGLNCVMWRSELRPVTPP
jgi:hypothetical protein